jgi:hypothetical protein
LEAQALLRRLPLPILPHGCQRRRPVGFLANRCKARALRQCRQRRGQPPALPPREQLNAVEWRRQRTGIDITQCPPCGSRPLVRQPLPLSHRSGAEPRGPPAVPTRARHALALDASAPHLELPRMDRPGPKGAVRVRRVWDLLGAGDARAGGRPWCASQGMSTPIARLWVPITAHGGC